MLGALSLVFWSLILVVTVKYVLLILRADNRGEGGVLALRHAGVRGRRPERARLRRADPRRSRSPAWRCSTATA